MANGEQAHAGAAACGYAWELGTVLRLSTGEVVACEDRGGGPYYWVDVWQGTFTGRGTCEVME
jgi:hypothetical protein